MYQDKILKIETTADPIDTAALRKKRGAFFTPTEITRFMADWAIQTADDLIFEPAVGDAAFLVAAVSRLRQLGDQTDVRPTVHGVEIHSQSVSAGCGRVYEAGGEAVIEHSDFFAIEPKPVYDAVIGNPPFIRFQNFHGDERARSREAALRAGVALSGLASSWAAFVIHSALFLKQGGRLALVLPAELLSVNYAAPVRKYLFNHFRDIQLVLFDEQVFSEAEADVVLLLADGYMEGPAGSAMIKQAKNAVALVSLGSGLAWTPKDPSAKWTSSLVDLDTLEHLERLVSCTHFTNLETWGDTTLGMVTGNNSFFTLSPQRARELDLPDGELLTLSPAGSSHLRGLSLTSADLRKLGDEGHATHLFCPGTPPSEKAEAYIVEGQNKGVDNAYKCRVRRVWHKVPLVPVADLLLTCMNADTPRITTNLARARHLNSVHGIYLKDRYRELGCELLPLASLNSITLLHAEMIGRAYGGGLLKIEPREADSWLVPSPSTVLKRASELRKIRSTVETFLANGKLLEAVAAIDRVLYEGHAMISPAQLEKVQSARKDLAGRRESRSASGRSRKAPRTAAARAA